MKNKICKSIPNHSVAVINGKSGKAAALPKFSDRLTQPKGADYARQLALPRQKNFCDYAPV